MWNRIDKTLSPAEIQQIRDAVKTIHDTITTGKALTPDESRKGGWYLSPKARLLLEKTLFFAKQNPLQFPNLDIAAFERDINLIIELNSIESRIKSLQYLVEDNRRLLTKDAAEQGFYVYNILKVLHNSGVGEAYGYSQLKEYMPRSGKKKPKAKSSPETEQ